MDPDVLHVVHRARLVSDPVELGLYVQHGCQCRSWSGAEHHVECVQCAQLPETQEAVGGLAWADCRMDRTGNEPGIARFPPLLGSH